MKHGGKIPADHQHGYRYFAFEATSDAPHLPTGDPTSYDPSSTVTAGVIVARVTSETRPTSAAVFYVINI
jgi:hypothetical protein